MHPRVIKLPHRLKNKVDSAILTHENGRYDDYKNSVLRSEIEKCKQLFEMTDLLTLGLLKCT